MTPASFSTQKILRRFERSPSCWYESDSSKGTRVMLYSCCTLFHRRGGLLCYTWYSSIAWCTEIKWTTCDMVIGEPTHEIGSWLFIRWQYSMAIWEWHERTKRTFITQLRIAHDHIMGAYPSNHEAVIHVHYFNYIVLYKIVIIMLHYFKHFIKQY